jgi:hypothetical protein
MTSASFYPIGTPLQPWGAAEKQAWLAAQVRHRSYADDVVARIDRLRARFEVSEYGRLVYGDESFPQLAVRSRNWNERAADDPRHRGRARLSKPAACTARCSSSNNMARITNGRVNLLVVPCVSPWAYERIHRWNPNAIDPNRSFREKTARRRNRPLAAPGRAAARQGARSTSTCTKPPTPTKPNSAPPSPRATASRPHPKGFPTGSISSGDTEDPQPAFQQAIIAAVEQVTHIAPPDANNQIIGSDVVAHGVINYPLRELGLCPSITNARLSHDDGGLSG